MATVAFLVHAARPEACALAEDTAAWLGAEGHAARVLAMTGADEVTEEGDVLAVGDLDLAGADVAVSLGGDGTFLRLVPLAWRAGIPVLGVNFGRLGYLLQLQPAQLRPALADTLAGTATIEERCVLDLSTDRSEGGAGSARWFALNEMVLEKTLFGHTVRLSTVIDGEEFLSYAADGLLIATPTGSTAYNLSAGGPVVAPDLRAMVMTPVAPHLSLDRSLVLRPDQRVEVRIEGERPAALVIDGLEAGRLEPGATVTCRVADDPLALVVTGTRGFAGLLRSTLTAERDRSR